MVCLLIKLYARYVILGDDKQSEGQTERHLETEVVFMVNIREVKTKRDIREFIEFPLRLYKGCEWFVPPLYGDEKKMILAGGKPDIAESVFLLAERDGQTVGRIQGILHKQYNGLHNTKRIRFTRFDSVNDTEVSGALFAALEAWGRERGMTELCGPLGYSDLDREGLLVEGFEENSTFEEQYNYDYYGSLCEAAGLKKEIDWLEFELKAPEKKNEMLERLANRVLELNKLHVASTRGISKRAYVDKYKDSFFECLDECYSKLYGTVPISPDMQKELIDQFMLLINKEFLFFICDESERVVAFGLCFPGIGDAVKKSGGRLTPLAIAKLLWQVKHPKTIDLGLVAVRPEYQNSGINAAILNGLLDMLCQGKAERCETNLNLETNTAVIAQWKHFTSRQHKRRRSYLKNIEEK
jgi:GNAT superfamily N-acetyltransferase